MKIAVAQTFGSPDVGANKGIVAGLIEKAAKGGADLIVFPEMSLTEFFPRIPHKMEYFDLAEPIPGPTMAWFAEQARAHGIHVVYNQYERSAEHLFFDTSVVIDKQGEFVGRQRMMHLAEEPGYNEKFYYTPGWDTYHVFRLDGWSFGIAICYDRHFPEVFRSMVLQGAEVVLVPTAVAGCEPFADVYELEMRAAAVTHGVYIAMANRAGQEGALDFLGRSMVIGPQGEVLATLGQESNELLMHDVDKPAVTRARTLFPFLRDRRPETYDLIDLPHAAFGENQPH